MVHPALCVLSGGDGSWIWDFMYAKKEFLSKSPDQKTEESRCNFTCRIFRGLLTSPQLYPASRREPEAQHVEHFCWDDATWQWRGQLKLQKDLGHSAKGQRGKVSDREQEGWSVFAKTMDINSSRYCKAMPGMEPTIDHHAIVSVTRAFVIH